ncbi:MAG: polysaccharide biosynthesis tyrosine autokinase [Pseudomonadota bacterium]
MNGTFDPDLPRASATNVPASPAPRASDNTIVDLGSLLSILWRHKLLLVITTMISTTIGGYYAYVAAVPTFASSATIVLNSREEQVMDFESVVSGLSADSSVLNTEVHVLRSRSLLGKVVASLSLEEDPEFNRRLRPPTVFDDLKLQIRTLLGILPEAEELTPEMQALRTREAAINGLTGTLSIRNLPSSLVFEVTVETTDPMKSARVADEIARQYILDQIAVKFEATAQATEWLAGQVGDLQAQLETAESNLANFRATANLVNAEELAARERQVTDLRERIADSEAAHRIATARQGRLAVASTPVEQAAAAEDVQLQQFLPRLSQASIAEAFEQRYEQIVVRAELEVSRLEQQKATLRASLAELEEEIDRQGDALITFQQLTREAEAIRLLYESFLRRLNETSAQEGIQQSDSRMLSSAVAPLNPSAPNKRLILVLSAVVGFMFGAVIAFVRALRNTAFRDAEDLETVTRRPVVGQIPVISARRRSGVLEYLISKPASRAAEAVRNMRTSVLLSQLEHPPQTMMICSCFPGEGKTTLSMALAQNLSAMGKSVLVIEGDIRRRVLSQYLDETAANNPGYLSVMAGDTPFEAAVSQHKTGGFELLLSGDSERNAADVLSSEGFRKLIDEARGRYDHVIIDTPPVLVVPDARIVSRQVDFLILTVAWNTTTRDQVRDAMAMFETVGRQIDGFALNQIKMGGVGRYGYTGYYRYSGAKYYVN